MRINISVPFGVADNRSRFSVRLLNTTAAPLFGYRQGGTVLLNGAFTTKRTVGVNGSGLREGLRNFDRNLKETP